MKSLIAGLVSIFIFWFGQNESAQPEIIDHYVLACDLIVDAGPDTSVCAPGGSVQLQGNIQGNDVFLAWSPASNVNNPNILNPVATVTGPTLFTLTAYGIDPDNPNLVFNGDFESGNIGFTTDYSFVMDMSGVQTEMTPEGTYTIINNPNLVHNGFAACSDHTPAPGDDMMVLNGSASLQNIWCQTVAVMPNSYYDVSAWVASVASGSPARLRFSINGVPLGAIVNAPNTTCIWTPFNAFWYSGASTMAEICILNLNTAAGGNDFAIDDIAMVELCVASDEVLVTTVVEDAPVPDITGHAFVCEDDVATYTATYPNDPEVLTVQWSIPTGGQILSGQGTQSIQVLWNEDGFQDVCLTVFTRCDEDDACLSVEVGTLPDDRNIIGPGSICQGESAILYVPELDPDDTYNWIFPSQIIEISGQGTSELEFEYGAAGEFEVCVEISNICGTVTVCQSVLLASTYQVLLDTAICEGTTIIINGNEYGNGILTGVETFQSIYGCDSIVEIEILETDALLFTNNISICTGDSVFVDGMFQHNSGIFLDSFVTQSGCDSIIETILTVEIPDTTYIQLTTCDPLATDTSIQTFTNPVCDSVVITQTILAPSDTTWIYGESCLESDTGTTITYFTNVSGCDSLSIHRIILLPSDTTQIFLSSCDITQVGTVNVTLVNQFGCDSLIRTTTLFSLSDTTRIFQITCDETLADTTESLFQNIQGCDSLVIHEIVWGGSDTTFLQSTTCDPTLAGIHFEILNNHNGCDSVISEEIMLLPSDTTYLEEYTCFAHEVGQDSKLLSNGYGCDSLIITTTLLLPDAHCVLDLTLSYDAAQCYGDEASIGLTLIEGLPPFQIILSSGTTQIDSVSVNALGSHTFSIYGYDEVTIIIRSENGITSSETFTNLNPPQLTIQANSTQNFNGFDLACFGDTNGGATVQIIDPGTPPYTYQWSDTQTQATALNLSAGTYVVTVLDNNLCSATSSIVLIEPNEMQQSISFSDPTCFGTTDGEIEVEQMTGGVMPWNVVINQQAGSYANSLTEGTYIVQSTDQSGCYIADTIVLTSPEFWGITLSGDTTLSFGESIQLQPTFVGTPSGAVQYDWSLGSCPNCQINTISPTGLTNLSLQVTDGNGCVESASMTISVDINRDVYIPNVFTPNNDGQNDIWFISANPFLTSIPSIKIFDRWGDQVFGAIDAEPNSTLDGWDGVFKSQPLQPGVYVYRVELLFQDGVDRTVHGNVTLIR